MVPRVGVNRAGLEGRPPAESWETEKLSLQLEREATRRRYEAQSEGGDLLQMAGERNSPSSKLVREDGLKHIGAINDRMRQIEEALHRIRTGRYGLCTSCGIEISRPRLAQDLAMEYCLLCQAESEASSSRRTL